MELAGFGIHGFQGPSPRENPQPAARSPHNKKHIMNMMSKISGKFGFALASGKEDAAAGSSPVEKVVEGGEGEKKGKKPKPNALECWDEILKTVGKRRICLFLDYDGTLSRIVSDPSKARLTPSMNKVLLSLAQKYPTTIVTGRSYETVSGFLNEVGNHVCVAASHGFDMFYQDGRSILQIGAEDIPVLAKLAARVQELIKGVKGASIENNKLSVSVHYRNVEGGEKDVKFIEEQVDTLLQHPDYKHILKRAGKKLFELRSPCKWNKGKAVMHFLTQVYPELECKANVRKAENKQAGGGSSDDKSETTGIEVKVVGTEKGLFRHVILKPALTTIDQLRDAVLEHAFNEADVTKDSLAYFSLMWNGKRLEGGRTVAEYGIGNNAIINVTSRFRGEVSALEQMRNHLADEREKHVVFYLGDDRTDEDAFRVLQALSNSVTVRIATTPLVAEAKSASASSQPTASSSAGQADKQKAAESAAAAAVVNETQARYVLSSVEEVELLLSKLDQLA